MCELYQFPPLKRKSDMKKALTILVLILLSGLFNSCSDELSGNCHNCKGGTIGYYTYLESSYSLGAYTYDEYAKLLSDAKQCKIVVCGTDFCAEHSKGTDK